MHELSIAQAVVEIAAAHANGGRVASVHVRVGRLRQVVPEALRLGFELCAVGTPVEHAELELEPVEIVVACAACGTASSLDGFPLACRACGSVDVAIVSGEELLVDELELEHEELTRSG